MSDIITLNKVNKFYGTVVPQQVLFDVDLSIESKTFNSIIGQSGSGKSTLLNIVGTLDKPTSGQVYINGRETSQYSKNELANSVQNVSWQIDYITYLPRVECQRALRIS